jgi:RHS repeat-associated protein
VGTPLELLSTGGAVEWSAQLSVWGQGEKISGERVSCDLRFQGQWFDEETGLHYNYLRYYDPEAGIFLSPDPIGLAGGLQAYAYTQNPLLFVDPIGLKGVATQTNPAKGPGNFAGIKLRTPDYYNFSFGFQTPVWARTPYANIFSGGGSFSVDRYGHFYGGWAFGPGKGFGKFSTSLFSANATGNYLLQGNKPSAGDLNGFLTGQSYTLGGGDILGGNVSFSPNAPGTKWSAGGGLFTPGISGSGGYSWENPDSPPAY